MSLDRCRACRNVGFCTFPKSRVVTECDEFEDADVAPAYDWDLQQLMRLWDVTLEPSEPE